MIGPGRDYPERPIPIVPSVVPYGTERNPVLDGRSETGQNRE